MTIELRLANYNDASDAKDLVEALSSYAKDPMGGGEDLSDYAKENVVNGLISTPNAFTVLAFIDGNIAGLANCMQSFSTFKCKPVINIHDMTVLTQYRGLGLSQKLLNAVEVEAQKRGACKITLEVLEGNSTAQQAYIKYGFSGYELDPKMGKALFWEKPIR